MNLINELKNYLNIELNSFKNDNNMNKNENIKKDEVKQFEFNLAGPFTNMLKINEHSNNNTNQNSENSCPKPQITSTNHMDTSLKCPIENTVQKVEKFVKLKYLLDDMCYFDKLHHNTHIKVACNPERCMGSLLQATKTVHIKKSMEEVMKEGIDFINQFYASVKREGSKGHRDRIDEIVASINKTGSYELKETELSFGARTAWRNAPRCIGRIQWSKLQLFDARYVNDARGIYEAICNHIKYATNKGIIRSAITIFRQRTEKEHDFRIWNGQFIGYAGYKIDDHTYIGDKANVEFTELCINLGWTPKYTEFDILPLVLQANGQDPEWFELPPEIVMQVEISHPKYSWFRDLKLQWYVVPAVSSMLLDVGGIEFPCCPFNGWYMCTEIGRNLADINRYDKLPLIAEKMGLDIKNNSSLWKDKALVELNYAILTSFQRANVTITDHHSAAESFMKHYSNENSLRGGCPGDWVWVVPPLSSHLTPVFHLEMLNYVLKPSYEYQDAIWKNYENRKKTLESNSKNPKRTFKDIARAVKFSTKLMRKALAKRVKCTILYATETGKSERFAKSLAEIFKHAFDAKIICMSDYDVVNLEHETLLLIVTSTFGNGDPPDNGIEFKKFLCEIRKSQEYAKLIPKTEEPLHTHIQKPLEYQNSMIYDTQGTLNNVRFSVFGLGNSSYPKFCSFGKFLDTAFQELGGERIHELGLGDELCGQEESFRKWSIEVYKSSLKAFCIDVDNSYLNSISSDDLSWSPLTVRLTLVEPRNQFELCESLSRLHSRKIYPCKLVSKKNLIDPSSKRVTLNVELNTQSYAGEMQYKPGDHIGILAENRKEIVDKILSKLFNAPEPDQLIQLEFQREKNTIFGLSKEWIIDDRFPYFTLRKAFTNFLDITSPLTQNMLMYLSAHAIEETDRLKLEKLAKDHLAYEEWKLNGLPNLAEVLDEFPSLRLNASLLIAKLPKLQPRFYSISSSPKMSSNIEITLGIVKYKPKGKSIHYGVCSGWLNELKEGDCVPAFVREAPNFRMPEDKTCPIIMIGAGTGIAPFRGFWQERKIDFEMMRVPTGINGIGWGKIVLYFGCRQSKVDELYKDEIEQLIKENVITSLFSAYSRDTGCKKVYVQNLLAKNMDEVYDLIVNKNGHFYVCGDVRMAMDVTNTLEQIISEKKKISLFQAKEYVNSMKEDLRFHEDIFGNSVKIITEDTD